MSDMPLAERSCVPCRGGVPALTAEDRSPLLAELDGWAVIDGHHLRKEFRFPDFRSALDWVLRAGEISEEQGHHPELTVSWGVARATIWTHAIDGLTESDFVLAAKFDKLAR
jgi:4a-hydroxytetrahydrobiopterin dehydratase